MPIYFTCKTCFLAKTLLRIDIYINHPIYIGTYTVHNAEESRG